VVVVAREPADVKPRRDDQRRLFRRLCVVPSRNSSPVVPGVVPDETIQTQVGVHLEGGEEAPGVKEGGVLEQVSHQLNIEALPTAIPEAIVVDVSGMEIAATMHLSEITAPEGVEFLDDPEETIIATVVVPTEVEEPEEIEEETELVGEEGEVVEGEEAAEGEEGAAPAEGEAAPSEEAEGSE